MTLLPGYLFPKFLFSRSRHRAADAPASGGTMLPIFLAVWANAFVALFASLAVVPLGNGWLDADLVAASGIAIMAQAVFAAGVLATRSGGPTGRGSPSMRAGLLATAALYALGATLVIWGFTP
ncbi:MAG: hypothetical protein ACP5O7_11880 [Phycisphaerae bacterium]